QVFASFGADQESQEYAKDPASNARNSIFGELTDVATSGDGINDGENEHPFELFMIATGGGPNAVPTEFDNPATGAVEVANLTIADQKTNATVTWNGGEILPVYLHQIDAHTIVGYVFAEGEDPQQALARGAFFDDEDTGKEAVFVITIDDNGMLTFVQYHQINHYQDGPTPEDHDDTALGEGAFAILGEDGTPVIQVRISDYDGDHATQPVNLVIQDDGPKFCGVDWGYDYDSQYGVGAIDEDKLQPNGNNDWAPGDNKGGTHTDGSIDFNFGVDQPGHLDVQSLKVTDSAGETVIDVTFFYDKNTNTYTIDGDNFLKTADGHAIDLEVALDPNTGELTLKGIDAEDGSEAFVYTLQTTGYNNGDFSFCLNEPLQHPYHDSDSANDGPEKSFEDNLNFDLTVRGYDVDGDWADGCIKIKVDDDSPDACKVEIHLGGEKGEDALLVQDETAGVQDKGDGVSGAGDPGHSGQDEDDVADPSAELAAFEVTRGLLANLGHAQTDIVVDLSGGSADADAAIGADRPGSVSAVSLVDSAGDAFDGDATNLRDTQTNRQIFLFTETVDGETFVVGRVGTGGGVADSEGAISFVLHVTDTGALELGQYRAIQHNDATALDESVALLGGNNQEAVVHLQVTVTDSDGDAVTVIRPLGGGDEGASAIVFQDDGPVIQKTENGISLQLDETVGGDGTDFDDPAYPGAPQDGPAIENDEDGGITLPPSLQGHGDPIGVATADASDLFSYEPGSDGELTHSYGFVIGNGGFTGLTDTLKG
ncbi:MAG TPA: DUF5801 repeats-in-toxin domain-containing protein, partial [Pirellulaceae bacterium]|nr:DUF5801 repeats-in-toxin domain-containing protein [Pirellulaceae bacterium]